MAPPNGPRDPQARCAALCGHLERTGRVIRLHILHTIVALDANLLDASQGALGKAGTPASHQRRSRAPCRNGRPRSITRYVRMSLSHWISFRSKYPPLLLLPGSHNRHGTGSMPIGVGVIAATAAVLTAMMSVVRILACMRHLQRCRRAYRAGDEHPGRG